MIMHKPLSWFSCSAITVVMLAAAAQGQPGDAKNVLTGAAWTTAAGEAGTVTAKAVFTVADLSAVGGLAVAPGAGQKSCTINGKLVEGPIAKISYAAIPLDPAKYLVKGENVIVVTAAGDAKSDAAKLAARVELLAPEALAIRTGPALGAISAESFTVICRTNLPAVVTVTAKSDAGKETTASSQRGFYHRLQVPLAAGTKSFTYAAAAVCGKASSSAGPFTVTVPASDGQSFRFAATGDCRTHWQRWQMVAEAIAKSKPDLMLFSGDMVTSGGSDEIWDREFFGPAKGLMTFVPTYPVIGNHENNCPEYSDLFYTPGGDGRAKNWSQQIGQTLLIGIDGTQKWEAASDNTKWLEGVLKDSKAKFIFLMSHYPGWTSGSHAKIPEATMLASRNVILPLLARYKATAMIVGHDHNYERSELPADKGVTSITSGAAGAPLRGQTKIPDKYNPYTKKFYASLCYCIFEVTADKCEMKTYDLNGNVIDERTFEPRK
ncbi:MAG: metallophosphoesterase [Planctomycetaceae bacterium]|nr:metallophosphoesterase [Planctomycetaceae bacterium]